VGPTNFVGQGSYLRGPSSAVVDSNNNQLIVSDIVDIGVINDKIYTVDLSTSDRTLLARPLSLQIKDLALDITNNRVLVSSPVPGVNTISLPGAIIAVDLTTGTIF
jgi:hypothetical protein